MCVGPCPEARLLLFLLCTSLLSGVLMGVEHCCIVAQIYGHVYINTTCYTDLVLKLTIALDVVLVAQYFTKI